MNELETYQQQAANIEAYLRDEKLHYGDGPNKNGDASWAIALHGHPVTPEQQQVLIDIAPQLIKNFHQGSEQLLYTALSPDRQPGVNPAADRLHAYLTAGVPEATRQLWDKAITADQHIFSTRPDMVITNGKFKIIEYNTDGGADKGNTQGVNEYSRQYLHESTLGKNLASLFIQGIREAYPEKETISGVTILPDSYRKEYDLQNSYFANQADKLGNKVGVRWKTAALSNLTIQDSRVVAMINGESIPVDVIDREFKLPGFTKDYNFEREQQLLEAVFQGKVAMLGSLLPLSDKVLLSTLFNPESSTVFEAKSLTQTQALHAETDVLDPLKSDILLGDNSYALDDIASLRPDIPLVLKRGGDTAGSTESKGIVFSPDKQEYEINTSYQQAVDRWRDSVTTALQEPEKQGSYWVVQHFYPSDRFPVLSMQNSRKKPQEYTVGVRVAPYYVRHHEVFSLGNVLVTAGTDRETRLEKNGKGHNIHGQRDNAYQPAVFNTDNHA